MLVYATTTYICVEFSFSFIAFDSIGSYLTAVWPKTTGYFNVLV